MKIVFVDTNNNQASLFAAIYFKQLCNVNNINDYKVISAVISHENSEINDDIKDILANLQIDLLIDKQVDVTTIDKEKALFLTLNNAVIKKLKNIDIECFSITKILKIDDDFTNLLQDESLKSLEKLMFHLANLASRFMTLK